MRILLPGLLGLLAVALVATACDTIEIPPVNSNVEGGSRLEITLASNFSPDSRNVVTTDMNRIESTIKNYMILIFDYDTGRFERQATGRPDGMTTVTGLSTAGAKRVVVIANMGHLKSNWNDNPNFNYASLQSPVQNFISSSDCNASNISSHGMPMSGETSPVTIAETGTTEVTVRPERMLAKITVGEVALATDSGIDPAKFTLDGVCVMCVPQKIPVGIGNLEMIESKTFFGGLQHDVCTGYDAFCCQSPIPEINGLGTPVSLERYFYVAPNFGSVLPTMVTLDATYEGVRRFYTVAVNGETVNDGQSNADGTFIRRDHCYRVSITIKDPTGIEDPDGQTPEGSLGVVTTIEPWE